MILASIEATWTQCFSIFRRRRNLYKFNNPRLDPKQLAMTIEAPEHLSKDEAMPTSKLTTVVGQLCNAISEVLSSITIRKYWPLLLEELGL